jgi:DNA polymerase-4
LQRFDKIEMSRRFGKWGLELWELCRGIDTREVESHRIRKSVRSQNTFREKLTCLDDVRPPMHSMLEGLAEDLGMSAAWLANQ